jgi:DNA-binding MarR family transcriptional regulator
MHDQEDRRRVVVQPTPEARRFGSLVFRPLGDELDEMLCRYSDTDRDRIEDFLRSVTGLVARRADVMSRPEQ